MRNPISVKDRGNYVVITGVALSQPIRKTIFMETVFEYYEKGYRMVPSKIANLREAPFIMPNRCEIKMYKPDYDFLTHGNVEVDTSGVNQELVEEAKAQMELEIAQEVSESVEGEEEVDLDSLTTKDQLKAFAESKNIEIPESKKNPAAMRKYIKEKLK